MNLHNPHLKTVTTRSVRPEVCEILFNTACHARYCLVLFLPHRLVCACAPARACVSVRVSSEMKIVVVTRIAVSTVLLSGRGTTERPTVIV
jgi:hypothetical protein